MDGLGQDTGAGRGAIPGRQGHGGEAGDEHDAQAVEAGGGLTGHLDAVHAGHDDVGEQQVPVALIQGRDRLLPVGAGGDVIARPFQGARQESPQGIVVFGQEDARHGCFNGSAEGGRPDGPNESWYHPGVNRL